MVFSFESFDDLFSQMQKDQEEADSRVTDWQKEIKAGDYVVRPGPGFPIYSEILEPGEDRNESLQHYRFTRSYSIACPNGELGDVHVSTLDRKISKDEFNIAKSNSWVP